MEPLFAKTKIQSRSITPIFNPNVIRTMLPQFNNSEITYLDNASTTPKPKEVTKTLIQYYTKYAANVHRGIYPSASIATNKFEEARNKVAQFINANSQEIIFTSGATASLNSIVRILEPTIKKDDEIVLTILEHHSNLVPWQQVAKRKGATLKFIPLQKTTINNQTFYDLNYTQAKKVITKKTKIIAYTACSNVTGEHTNITLLQHLAKKVNAYTVIDATQAAASHLIDVKQWDCDFLAFSGHKMYGPTGIGIMYGKKQLLETLEPVSFGGEMINQVHLTTSTWNELPYKFEPGTPPIAEAIALKDAIEFIEKIDQDIATKHLQNLTQYLRTKLHQHNCNIITSSTSTTITSFTHNIVHAHDIAEILGQQNICVRSGHHCCMPLHKELKIPATTRISLSYYNTKEDIDKLIAALDRAIKKMSKKTN